MELGSTKDFWGKYVLITSVFGYGFKLGPNLKNVQKVWFSEYFRRISAEKPCFLPKTNNLCINNYGEIKGLTLTFSIKRAMICEFFVSSRFFSGLTLACFYDTGWFQFIWVLRCYSQLRFVELRSKKSPVEYVNSLHILVPYRDKNQKSVVYLQFGHSKGFINLHFTCATRNVSNGIQ